MKYYKIPLSVPLFAVAFSLFSSTALFAQSGSITGTTTLLTPNGRPMTMTEASTTFRAPPKQRMFQVDDIIYVHIEDVRRYSNTANNQRKKRISAEASLTAWSKIGGLFKLPVAASSATLPEIGGSIDHNTQNQGRLIREESVDFYIACYITDIRDNGNLVIEGNRSSAFGEEGNIITVTGIVRPDTIGPDFRIKSNDVAELEIREIPRGNVFDTVRRPWGTRLVEQLKPF